MDEVTDEECEEELSIPCKGSICESNNSAKNDSDLDSIDDDMCDRVIEHSSSVDERQRKKDDKREKEVIHMSKCTDNALCVDESYIRTSMGERPDVSTECAKAPSALREEREARANVLTYDDTLSEAFVDDDPDLICDEVEYTKCRPIIREFGKSKPCYRVPFSSCVHMPFVDEMSNKIPLYKMTADRYSEQNSKNLDTTKEIIATLTPAKLAQQVAVFKVLTNKSQSGSNLLRRYAAFLRVEITDLDEASASLSQPLADGQALYQLHPQEFTRLFKGDHALKLPKSLVPIPKTVEYVKLVPKAESEAKPEGWIMCHSVGDAKNNKRTKEKCDKERGQRKQRKGETSSTCSLQDNGHTNVVHDKIACDSDVQNKIDVQGRVDDFTTRKHSVYSEYSFVESTSTTTSATTPIVNGNDKYVYDWRSESYKVDLKNCNTWPCVVPSFDFVPEYTSFEVSFKVFKGN
jgi:hypothetical protein